MMKTEIKIKDLKIGDVVSFLYGSEYNRITIKVVDVRIRKDSWIDAVISGWDEKGEPFHCFGKSDDTVELIERNEDERNRN